MDQSINDELKEGLKSSTQVFCQCFAKTITNSAEGTAVGGRAGGPPAMCCRGCRLGQRVLGLGLREWELEEVSRGRAPSWRQAGREQGPGEAAHLDLPQMAVSLQRPLREHREEQATFAPSSAQAHLSDFPGVHY